MNKKIKNKFWPVIVLCHIWESVYPRQLRLHVTRYKTKTKLTTTSIACGDKQQRKNHVLWLPESTFQTLANTQSVNL